MKRLVLVSVFALLFLAALASGQVMRGKRVVEDASYLRYEGTLTDPSGNPVSGVHEMTFRIYDSPSSLTPVWEEVQQVAVDGGVFEAVLGKRASIPRIDDSDYYIAVIVDGEELLPRHRIAGTVISGENASFGVTGPVPSPYFPVDQMDERYVNVTGDSMSGDLYVDGNVGIGTTNPLNRLDIAGDLSFSGSTSYYIEPDGDNASVRIGTNTNYLGIVPNSKGNNKVELFTYGYNKPIHIQAGGIFIGSEANYSDPGNNNLIVYNGKVGIGTTSPSYKLDVNGSLGSTTVNTGQGDYELYAMNQNVRTTDNPTFNRVHLSDYGTALGGLHVGGTSDPGTDNLIVDGKVGIGTTSPGGKLDINGNAITRGHLLVGQTDPIGYQGITADGNDLIVNGQLASGGTGGAAIYKLGIGYAPPDGGEGSLNVAGNLGIGTTSPGAKLEVMGSVRIADRLKFSQNGYWADMDIYTGSPSSWPRLNIYETPGGGSRTKTAKYSQGALSLTGSSASIDVNGPISAKDNSSVDAAVYGETSSLGHSGGSDMGVYGWAYSGGASVGGAAIGVLGRVNSYQGSGASVPAGVFGWATATSGVNAGVWGETNSPNGFGVYSAGDLSVDGDFYCNGSKNAVVETSRGQVAVSCMESPEIWFEDFGEGKLRGGRAHVDLAPLFLETVTIDAEHPMKVFIQLNDDCRGVYTKRGERGFDVIELQGGSSDASFSYRVVAKRKGYEGDRFTAVHIPTKTEMAMASRHGDIVTR